MMYLKMYMDLIFRRIVYIICMYNMYRRSGFTYALFQAEPETYGFMAELNCSVQTKKQNTNIDFVVYQNVKTLCIVLFWGLFSE